MAVCVCECVCVCMCVTDGSPWQAPTDHRGGCGERGRECRVAGNESCI